MQQDSLFPSDMPQPDQVSNPVTCLGKTFASDQARRDYFLALLAEKLKDPEFRKVEGFPIGSDVDILNLSDPPYYTACPNPFLDEFIVNDSSKLLIDGSYKREPLASDVSQGKNEPIYNVHSYPTKVPPGAIRPLIDHFCRDGDVILDPFCGTGMTGVAALESSRDVQVILQDLSPTATHIAASVQSGHESRQFQQVAKKILDEVRQDLGWMYSTNSSGNDDEVRYFVWSDVYLCAHCSADVLIWDIEGAQSIGGLKEMVPCPSCGSHVSKQSMSPKLETIFDPILKKPLQRIKSIPVLKAVASIYGGRNLRKLPISDFDIDMLKKIDEISIGDVVKTQKMLFKDGCWGEQWRSSYHTGVTNSHHFYTLRNYLIINEIWNRIDRVELSQLKSKLVFWFTASLSRVSRLNRYMQQHNRHVGPLAGTLFIGPIQAEISPFYFFSEKIKDLSAALIDLPYQKKYAVSTGSSASINLPDNSIDFIFTDPPFGDNLIYSELNFLIESWLNVFTKQQQEAVIAKTQGKDLKEFEVIMKRVFAECYRVLKPGHWIVVEFHNSRNSVWAAIQEALGVAGFVIADVRTLDKKKGTTKQLTQAGTVKQDLIISAYKQNYDFESSFKLNAGTEDGVWSFVRSHLENLPVFVDKNGRSEVLFERKEYLLYDRMLAFHVQRGITVPYSASAFYKGLEERFYKRDGMYFLPSQAVEYDKNRASSVGVEQIKLFITDEASARQWLRDTLKDKPQSFQELHPHFMKEISGWSKTEKRLELLMLLEQNFLRYDGKDEIPHQILSNIMANSKELNEVGSCDPKLKIKAKDCWYVPDPNEAGDLEKLREKSLLKEFEEYKAAKKKLKVFRIEAVRVGFKKFWEQQEFAALISVAEKLPNNVLEEDPVLLMYYDQAVTLSQVDADDEW